MALEKLIATGLPVSVSVMFPTPWYQETVDTKEYGLGMMGFFGDTGQNPQYEAAPGNKTDSVVAYVNRLRPGSTYSSPTLGSTMRGWRRMTTFTSSRFAS